MGDLIERLVLLPLTACISQSSVNKSRSQAQSTSEEEKNISGDPKVKSSYGFLHIPKSNMTSGLQKMVKNVKKFSQFSFIEEDGDDEYEMEIGCPTDVKHVSHIGLDEVASTATNFISWGGNRTDNVKSFEDLLSLP